MHVSDAKKHQYWNHFVARLYTTSRGFPTGVTGPRLRKLKPRLWHDRDFWQDIVLRHGGDKCTPEEMRRDDLATYEHCQGNFWGMITQDLRC